MKRIFCSVLILAAMGCGGGGSSSGDSGGTPSVPILRFERESYSYKTTDRNPEPVRLYFASGNTPLAPSSTGGLPQIALGAAQYPTHTPITWTANVKQTDLGNDYIEISTAGPVALDVATMDIAGDGTGDLQEGSGEIFATIVYFDSAMNRIPVRAHVPVTVTK